MWPRRSRRTLLRVTSTPHLSQMTPRCFMRLYFAAQAFPVGDRTENFGAEQAVALRLEGAVIDGFRLGDFAVRPGADFLRAGQADADGIEISDQTGTIIGAAAIQGRFLPARTLRRGPRSDVARPAETQLRKLLLKTRVPINGARQARRYGWIRLVGRLLCGGFCRFISSTSRHSDCNSRTSTLNDSGTPGSMPGSPFTMAS